MAKQDYDYLLTLVDILIELGEKDKAADIMTMLLIHKITDVVCKLLGDDK